MTAPVVNIIVVIIIIIIIIIEHCYRPLLVSVVIYPALLRASHIQSHSEPHTFRATHRFQWMTIYRIVHFFWLMFSQIVYQNG